MGRRRILRERRHGKLDINRFTRTGIPARSRDTRAIPNNYTCSDKRTILASNVFAVVITLIA